MRAGFSKARITPPIGTRMSGFGGRDQERGAESVHDDLHARVLYVEDGVESALIVGFDLLFFSRENADQLKSALGRALDLSPRQVLLNTSHTHTGPCVDTWNHDGSVPPDLKYMAAVESALIRAANEAKSAAHETTVWAGAARSRLPVSRRRLNAEGRAEFRPDPEGTVCDHLPICLFRDEQGAPVCLLYSVSCHPSTIGGWSISPDYPGVACDLIDEHLGAQCSLFLQGAGGDAKACVIADDRDDAGPCWRDGNWDDVAAAGKIVADEVMRTIDAGLQVHEPELRASITEMEWPLQPLPGRGAFEVFAEDEYELRRLWARRQIEFLDKGKEPASAARLLAQRVQLAASVRLVAIEGELVAELGRLIIGACGAGITFPLGYSNGTGLYLPTSAMLSEGGYEVDSYYEYGLPAQLAGGMETVLEETLAQLRRSEFSDMQKG